MGKFQKNKRNVVLSALSAIGFALLFVSVVAFGLFLVALLCALFPFHKERLERGEKLKALIYQMISEEPDGMTLTQILKQLEKINPDKKTYWHPLEVNEWQILQRGIKDGDLIREGKGNSGYYKLKPGGGKRLKDENCKHSSTLQTAYMNELDKHDSGLVVYRGGSNDKNGY